MCDRRTGVKPRWEVPGAFARLVAAAAANGDNRLFSLGRERTTIRGVHIRGLARHRRSLVLAGVLVGVTAGACGGGSGGPSGEQTRNATSTTLPAVTMADITEAVCIDPDAGGPAEAGVVWALPDEGGGPPEGDVGRRGALPAGCAGVEVVGRSTTDTVRDFNPAAEWWYQVHVAASGLEGWVWANPCGRRGETLEDVLRVVACEPVVTVLPLVEPRLAVEGAPDLALEITPLPYNFKPGDSCYGGGALVPRYKVVVFNRGTAATTHVVEYTASVGQPRPKADVRVRGLEPGESFELEYDEKQTFTIDPNNLIPESDETNNQAELLDRPDPGLECR